jgi:hypothetical protein
VVREEKEEQQTVSERQWGTNPNKAIGAKLKPEMMKLYQRQVSAPTYCCFHLNSLFSSIAATRRKDSRWSTTAFAKRFENGRPHEC